MAAGTPPDVAARQVAVKGSVLLQPVNTAAAERALRGETGTTIAEDYLGEEVLSAFTPLEIPGLRWALVTKKDASEAFAPVDDFTSNIVLATAAIIFGVTLLSLLFAQVFARPLRRLTTAVRQVAAGERGVQVPDLGRDEFGELGRAFNDLSRNLGVKQDLIDEGNRENDRLPHTLMPESAARRYREGEETVAASHADVSVIYADLMGIDELTADLGSDEEVALVNAIFRGFDDAAEQLGVDKVRTLRSGYLANCGLTIPRVDHARRAVDFAVAMQGVVDRYNIQHGTRLQLRAGVDSGTVTSGLLGRSGMQYDMWGDAVNIAYRVQGLAGQPGIFVSQRIRDQIGETRTFADAGTVDSGRGTEPVWRLELGART